MTAQPDPAITKLLLDFSQAAGGSHGRAILIMESDLPDLTATLTNHLLEARIDELRRLLLTTACSRLGCTTNHQLKYNTVQKRIAELKALGGTTSSDSQLGHTDLTTLP